MNRNLRPSRFNKVTTAATAKKPGISSINLAGICENNWGQGDEPSLRSKPHIWYHLEDRLNVPDQILPVPPKLFGLN